MRSVHTTELAGLRSPVLADYLIALGLLRALSRQCDEQATLAWRPDGTPVLTSRLEQPEVEGWFLDEFAPSPIVAPWNAASGFNDNGKSPEAERVVASVEASTDARFVELREAVAAGRAVVAEGRARGWDGDTMWAKAHKHKVLALARNRLPDAALPWIDTAAALTGAGDVGYSPIAGTGGNLGRQELSVTYLQQLSKVIGPGADRDKSGGWFRAVMTGVEETPYERGTVGQFDPGRAGGIHSSIFGEPDKAGFVNPWRIILTCEGLVLFASSVARRHALDTGAANPFIARSTPYGYASASSEKSKGELWAPVWEQPAALCELEQLLGEGRVRYRGRQARDGFDFARAAGSLAVGRGVRGFRRFVFVKRLGRSPLAVHAGDIRVGRRLDELELVGESFDWLSRISENPKTTPTSV
ncbi:type I-U CRISPR-associated protein Csx17, partial [Streptomyces xiamenensis]|uniref:type I-G CRISPR-associated protein Cas8g1/Csx17 n=1 Tax=Streptomyces xiamenensis TaxID=408015 RepID=UPI0035DF38AE